MRNRIVDAEFVDVSPSPMLNSKAPRIRRGIPLAWALNGVFICALLSKTIFYKIENYELERRARWAEAMTDDSGVKVCSALATQYPFRDARQLFATTQ